MSHDIYRAVYISHAKRAFSQSELDGLLWTSRRRNKWTGLTGMLVHSDGVFFQALEGRAFHVREAVDRIFFDKRHKLMKVLHTETCNKRAFPGWAMGFRRVSGDDPWRAGFFDLTQKAMQDRLTQAEASNVIKLLQDFAQCRVTPEAAPKPANLPSGPAIRTQARKKSAGARIAWHGPRP